MIPPETPSASADALPPPDRWVQAMALALARVAEPGEAGRHIQRIGLYVQALANHLCLAEPWASRWPPAVRQAMVQASALHDIGNSVVPDRILLKPGLLTPEEFATARRHTAAGRDIIAQVQQQVGEPSDFLAIAQQIACSHHERWDGKGYPQGLAGEAIPAPALLMAIADAYDALTSDRIYRAGIAHEQAIGQMFQERGRQFAPDMIDALIEVQDAFADIARRFADSESDLQRRIDYMANAIAEAP